MSADQVMTSMTGGKMMEQAADLSGAEMFAISAFLSSGSARTKNAMPASSRCSGRPISTESIQLGGWGIDVKNTRYQPDSSIDASNVGQLELAWAFALPDVADARSQPVVTDDTIFVAAVSGPVYALDRSSGCIKWDYDTGATLRTSMSIGRAGEQTALFVGDNGGTVHAVNAHTGEPLWSKSVAVHSANTTTGTPVLSVTSMVTACSSQCPHSA